MEKRWRVPFKNRLCTVKKKLATFFCNVSSFCSVFLRHGEASAVHRGGATDAGGEHAPAEEAAAGDGEERSSVPAAE